MVIVTTQSRHQLTRRALASLLRSADRWLLGALVMALVLHASWLAFKWGPATWQPYLANLLSELPTVLAVIFAWRGARAHSGYLRRGWVFIALGLSAAAFGDLLWTFQELVLRTDPFPSVADLFYLLFVPCFLLGFYYLARLPLVNRGSLRLDLDAMILISAAAVVSWHFFFAPLLGQGSEDSLTLLVSLAYPALDLILFSLMALTILRPNGWNGPGSILFAFALLSFLVADVAYTLLVAADAYVAGHPIDSLWVLSTVLFAFAIWVDRYRTDNTTAPPQPIAAWSMYVPYLAIAVSYSLLFLGRSLGDEGTPLAYMGVLLGTALVTLLVVTRQVLTLRDNQKLSRQLNAQNELLEERVRERTRELSQANQDLLELSRTLDLRVQERTAELEASRTMLAHQARHDILTGLPNRAALEEHLQLAVSLVTQEEKSLCLFFIDLDGFKLVNDSYGHEAGDQLLREVAERLRNSLRHGDVVARLGGDEFVVLLPALEEPKHAGILAAKFLKVLQEPFALGDHTVEVGASIGVSLLPQDATDMAALQRHADIAMYQAKHSGKNSFRFYSDSFKSSSN